MKMLTQDNRSPKLPSVEARPSNGSREARGHDATAMLARGPVLARATVLLMIALMGWVMSSVRPDELVDDFRVSDRQLLDELMRM
jgi:hypothetical protein